MALVVDMFVVVGRGTSRTQRTLLEVISFLLAASGVEVPSTALARFFDDVNTCSRAWCGAPSISS